MDLKGETLLSSIMEGKKRKMRLSKESAHENSALPCKRKALKDF